MLLQINLKDISDIHAYVFLFFFFYLFSVLSRVAETNLVTIFDENMFLKIALPILFPRHAFFLYMDIEDIIKDMVIKWVYLNTWVIGNASVFHMGLLYSIIIISYYSLLLLLLLFLFFIFFLLYSFKAFLMFV